MTVTGKTGSKYNNRLVAVYKVFLVGFFCVQNDNLKA